MAEQAYIAEFAIISTILNVVGSNTQDGTTATINMYEATQAIGSQDAHMICLGECSSAVNNRTLAISSANFNLQSLGSTFQPGNMTLKVVFKYCHLSQATLRLLEHLT